MFKIKRIYEEPAASDGYRVLVDRLWPRGVSKERAALDDWAKEVAPSAELRTWFDHDPAKFDEFTARYKTELKANPAVNELLSQTKDKPTITLLYGAKDPVINQANVLQQYLQSLT
jgi:uncharacterized protein YeaO (DUF488 family)